MVNGTEMKLSQTSSLPRAIFNSSAKHFTLLAQRRAGQDTSKKHLVHVVKDDKEDETLSSISKLYGVPILEFAAANKGKIGNFDLVFKGQRLNIIPSAIARFAQVCHFGENKLHKRHLPNETPSLRFDSRQWTQMIFTVTSSHRLPIAKTTGLFLVLAPLIAFCIRCVMGAFRNMVTQKLRNRTANKSGVKSNNSMRWKTVLSDLTDPNAIDDESEPIPDPTSDDHEQLHFEVMSGAYSKLEDEYQQFLSECGVSNEGYWRGGSLK